MSYGELKDKIYEKHSDFSKNQKKIADYLINNFDRVPFLSVEDVSRSTGTSVATVVRFAQFIGFKGFSQMRAEIANALQQRIKNKKIFPFMDNLDDDTLTTIANMDIENINATLNLIERESFNHLVDLILQARKVYTAGLGVSYILSQLLSYQLSQIGINSSFLYHGSANFLEQLLYAKKNDVLICFSFPPYSRETISGARLCKEKNIRIASITDNYSSPVTLYTETDIVVQSKNLLFTNSFASISVLINAIVTDLAVKRKDKAREMLRNLDYCMSLLEES